MDSLPTEHRSRLMSRIPGRGNKSTEVAMARLFRLHGLSGWRRHLPLPGRPDFCFVRQRVAVFVDGCFWHACPRCYVPPKTNTLFWDRKRKENKARDGRVGRELRALGYRVIRIWEHQLGRPAAFLQKIRRLTT